MKVSWDSVHDRVRVTGQGKPAQPRHWVVALRIKSEGILDNLVIRPERPLVFFELLPVVHAHVREHYNEDSDIRVSFVATAR